MFDDMPMKRPHRFFLIAGRKYFALRKCASKLVAIVFRQVGRSSSSIERFGKYPALFTTISTSPTSRAARHGRGRGLIEERHREVSEIEKLRFNPLSLMKLLKNPLRRLFGEAALTRAADDH